MDRIATLLKINKNNYELEYFDTKNTTALKGINSVGMAKKIIKKSGVTQYLNIIKY